MAAGGMHFGGHSHSHPWFDWIDAEARAAEIKASAEWLQQIEPGPWAFAYPYGGLSEDSPHLLKAAWICCRIYNPDATPPLRSIFDWEAGW